MTYLRKRAGTLLLAASVLVGGLLPLAASQAAAATDPLAGSAGPQLLYPHMPTDSDQPVPPPQMSVAEFMRHPVLSWGAITSLPVTRYRVQLSPNADWTNNQVALPDGGLTTVTQYELPTTLPQASYFWRVRGEDAAGHHTNWSGAMSDSSDWQFRRGWDDAPTLTGGNLADGSVELSWTPMTDADTYEFMVSNNPGFLGSPDPLFSFTCFTNHPRVSLQSDSGDAKLEGDCNAETNLFKKLSEEAGSTWYWKVRGIDGTTAPQIPAEAAGTCFSNGSDCSAWSTVNTFVVPSTGTTASGLATNLAVNCGATVPSGSAEPLCADTPTLSWDAVPGADSYLVDVSTTPTFTTLYRAYSVHYGHSLTPRDSYLDNQAGKSYYWRVRACVYNPDPNDYSCSSLDDAAPVSMFHKHSVPLPLAPQSSSSSTHGHDGLFATVDNGEAFAERTRQIRVDQLTLHWDDALEFAQQSGGESTQDAKNYEVAYADNADFDGATTLYVDAPFWTPSPTLPDGAYYWKVQPIDGSGNHLSWSDTATFVKGTVPPVASIAASGYLTATQKVQIHFTTPVSGVSSSSLGITDVLSGRHVAGSTQAAGPDTAFFTPSAPLVAGQLLKVWVTGAVVDLAGNPAKASNSQARVNPTVDSASSVGVAQAWASSTDSRASGGSYARSASAGDTMTFRVSGSALKLIGTRMSNGGYADVLVDGVKKGTASFYASSTRWQQTVFSTTVSSGAHVVTVSVRGTHPSGSHGSYAFVDALKVDGSAVQQSGRLAASAWSTHRSTDAFAGSYVAESGYVAGSAGVAPVVTVKVSGGRVKVYGCKSPDSGYMGVYVDGVYKGRADLYQSYSSCNALVYTAVIAHGTRTLGFRAAGSHRAGAKGTRVALDRFVVSDS